jgi:hypothetical protein
LDVIREKLAISPVQKSITLSSKQQHTRDTTAKRAKIASITAKI